MLGLFLEEVETSMEAQKHEKFEFYITSPL